MKMTWLPDADPVDQHVGRTGSPAGIGTAGARHREIQHHERRVAGLAEGQSGSAAAETSK